MSPALLAVATAVIVLPTVIAVYLFHELRDRDREVADLHAHLVEATGEINGLVRANLLLERDHSAEQKRADNAEDTLRRFQDGFTEAEIQADLSLAETVCRLNDPDHLLTVEDIAGGEA